MRLALLLALLRLADGLPHVPIPQPGACMVYCDPSGGEIDDGTSDSD